MNLAWPDVLTTTQYSVHLAPHHHHHRPRATTTWTRPKRFVASHLTQLTPAGPAHSAHLGRGDPRANPPRLVSDGRLAPHAQDEPLFPRGAARSRPCRDPRRRGTAPAPGPSPRRPRGRRARRPSPRALLRRPHPARGGARVPVPANHPNPQLLGGRPRTPNHPLAHHFPSPQAGAERELLQHIVNTTVPIPRLAPQAFR
jgi:hypothetical protein